MIRKLLKERILILDGAMGTSIQKLGLTEKDFRGNEFENHLVNIKGNNDILNITQSDVVRQIHRDYIAAGADIIETNTFNSNEISQKEYHLPEFTYRLNFQGAQLAKQEAMLAQRAVFVAGSIGPTSKMLSLSPDVNRPAFREIDFDTMVLSYSKQVEGLLDGGADLLLVETVFDGINAKAALYSISTVFEQKGVEIPVMLSATVNDRTGHLLTGQNLEALFYAVSHFPLLSFGLNCSFGANMLFPLIERLNKIVPCCVSIHPNAGLPNKYGCYDETPEFTANEIKKIAQKGLVNIVGGCCGTTPEHIKCIKQTVEKLSPRKHNIIENKLIVSGNEIIVVDKNITNFINIGERTNVAGSSIFAKLIKEQDYEKAASIAQKQVESGASIIDINMDNALLDSKKEMENFVRYINSYPNIARAAIMIDSSDWQTILAGLKNCQGKPIVNSISLKEGEDVFLSKAKEIKKLGATVVVMAFDEQGQAVDFQRKIDICRRSYDLLTEKVHFFPHDIIFDVNILTIGTGLAEHNNYAVDYIKAVKWIKNNLNGALTSGGISNLSFSFRGNNIIRNAMHSIFTYHAINAGLDMGIINPVMLQNYNEINPELLLLLENLILNRKETATEDIMEYSERLNSVQEVFKNNDRKDDWRNESLEKRLSIAITNGISDYLNDDINEALEKYDSPVKVIEEPLMQAMDNVGELFQEGKIFLPHVLKSAQMMRIATDILQPYLVQFAENKTNKRKKIVLATAKGDVHDIGKNILSIVLSCAGLEVIDLGVMVDNTVIISEINKHNADIAGISGLITPSLSEMEDLCNLMTTEKMSTPLFVGGAATSQEHTVIKLSPLYHSTFYGGNASAAVSYIKKILQNKEKFIENSREKNRIVEQKYHTKDHSVIPFEEAKKRKQIFSLDSFIQKNNFGQEDILIKDFNISDLIDFINWNMFFRFWGFKQHYPDILENKEANELFLKGLEILNDRKNEIIASVVVKFLNAYSADNQIIIDKKYNLPMLRQQSDGEECKSLADYLPDIKQNMVSKIGLFCVSVKDLLESDDRKNFDSLLKQSLCARIAEALTEWIEKNISRGNNVIRPAFGYSSCPDHSMKKNIFEILNVEKEIDVSLSENYDIIPATSTCGMFIAHPKAKIFNIKNIDIEQFTWYSQQRKMTENQEKRFLGHLLPD
ncbi:MAG: methionine synthase [Prevotellaceae bacterium]|jgi:5-methyltetrahydrofolate--homocysteine methyltransferase|nr:methionine synthase [Prevotellaceae bacterium]